MHTMTIETSVFDYEIKDCYEKEDFNTMKEIIDALIHDTFDGKYIHGFGIPMDLILTNIARFKDKEIFLKWVYTTYPHYEAFIHSKY